MNTYANKTQENKSQSVSAATSQRQSSRETPFHFVDNRPEAVAQRKLQEMMKNSPQAKQAARLQTMADSNSAQQQNPIQKKENNTSLPDNLKSGIENLSGYSMDDVKVHYNSVKPAQLQAHAYAQGTEIHLASGQEKHLPHEAWHVVQQKQGRVKPTMQMKGEVNVNDDAGLEKEASVMGAKAMDSPISSNPSTLQKGSTTHESVQMAENTQEQSARPGGNWGKMHDKVVGNAKRTTKDVDKAGIAQEMMEEGKKKIREGVQTNNQELVAEGENLVANASEIRKFAQLTTAVKRLVGGNWEEKGAFSEETDEKGNRKVKMRNKVDANGEPIRNDKGEIEQKKIESRHQLTTHPVIKSIIATDADGQESEKIIEKGDEKQGLGREYDIAKEGMGSNFEEIYQDYARKQLEKFEKSHAYISEWSFGQILNVWKNWGMGTNFVSPLSDAENLLKKAKDKDGIATLEKELGIPEGKWASSTNSIYRFIVHDPNKFNLRLPKGMEGGAYQNEWVLGGKTLGGAAEAVINAMNLEDLKTNVANGAIEIKRVTFIGAGQAEQSSVSL